MGFGNYDKKSKKTVKDKNIGIDEMPTCSSKTRGRSYNNDKAVDQRKKEFISLKKRRNSSKHDYVLGNVIFREKI